MKFTFTRNFQPKLPVIFPVFFEKKRFVKSGKSQFDAIVEKALLAKAFEGKAGETYVHKPEKKNLPKNIVFVSLGDSKKLKTRGVLNYFATAVKVAKKERGNVVSCYVPKELEKFAENIAQALIMANYNPAQYKTGKEARAMKEHDIQSCVFIGNERALRAFTEKGRLVAEATNYARDLVNGPPNIVGPEYLESEAQKLAKEFGYKIRVLRNKELEKLGMNGILAVNRGSKKEARLIILEYQPENSSEKPIVITGKGVIFDSGGYNLKPSGYIENMHLDMAGAASVLGLFKILKKLGVKFPVVGIAPVTENCIDAAAYKPSEIIKMYSGKTVEITNTDAEGRMILADALAYANKEFKPRYLLDIATLTGACMIALGERYAGLFGNDKELKKMLRRAGSETDELLWPLPIHPDFEKSMKGEISDLRNGEDTPRYAGASKGAAFLKVFVGKTKWAHIDIAGPSYVTEPKKYETRRATGFGVRLLTRFLENLS